MYNVRAKLKNLWRNYFKNGVYLGKQPLSKTVPVIPQKMCGSYVVKDFSTNFKRNKNVILANISKKKKM